MGIAGISSTLRYAVQTHESTFSDSLLSNLPVAPPIIELVVALPLPLAPLLLLLLAIGTDAVAAAGGTTLLPLAPLLLLPAATAAALLLDDAPLNLAQLNLSPQLPFLDLAPVEVGADAVELAAAATCFDC